MKKNDIADIFIHFTVLHWHEFHPIPVPPPFEIVSRQASSQCSPYPNGVAQVAGRSPRSVRIPANPFNVSKDGKNIMTIRKDFRFEDFTEAKNAIKV
jgi:hypothetical protein